MDRITENNRNALGADAPMLRLERERYLDRRTATLERAAVVFYRLRLDPAPRFEALAGDVRPLTGYGAEEFLADPGLARRLIHPDDRRRLESVLANPSHASSLSTFRLVHRDGRMLPIEHVSLVTRSEPGEPATIEGVLRDVSGLQHYAERSQPVISRARAASDDIPAVLYLADRAGFTSMSPAIEQFTGFSADDWILQPGLWAERLHPDDRTRVLFLSTGGAAGKAWQAEYRWLARDGRILWIRQASAPIRDEHGELICLQGLMLDHTATKDPARRSSEAERMEAISRLAGVLAHDFNNLLTVVLGHAEMLLETFREPGSARGSTLEIKNAAETAARITTQLLAMSGRQALTLTRVDVNEIIRDIDDLLCQLAGEVDLRFDLAAELPPVDVDVKQMERVFRYLVAEAREAIPSTGRITIATCVVSRGGRRDVALSVADTRAAMSDDAAAQLFEPAFGPRRAPRGSGLNRAAIYGIIKQIGGRLTVDRPASGGVTFTISLPVIDK